MNEILLVAPCGMNCCVCMAYLREKNKCPGCRGTDVNKPITRVRCKLKTCETLNKDKLTFCYECEKFPCDNLKHLEKRYCTKYHMSMIENLENIKKLGIEEFLTNEKIRWTCTECGGAICVHKGICFNCGKKYL
jgi:hypothetical protein